LANDATEATGLDNITDPAVSLADDVADGG